MRYRNYEKYRNKKTEIDGLTFDSKKEAKHWVVLKYMEQNGEITDLQRQVKFVLIPQQREPDTVGPKGGLIKGKVIEREVSYIADFVYKDRDGNTVVEDVKGFRTPEYVLKRKLLLWVTGLRIREI